MTNISRKIDVRITVISKKIDTIQEILSSAEELKNNDKIPYIVSHLNSIKELIYSYGDLIFKEIEKWKGKYIFCGATAHKKITSFLLTWL